jgi:hypothetical protein
VGSKGLTNDHSTELEALNTNMILFSESQKKMATSFRQSSLGATWFRMGGYMLYRMNIYLKKNRPPFADLRA